VHVVRHLAIGPHLDPEPLARFREPIAIKRVAGVLGENALAPIAALGDVMRQAGNHDAGDTGHEGHVTRITN
jgi:hypothetical protein